MSALRRGPWTVERTGVMQVKAGGPAIQDLIRGTLEDLADSIHAGDTLADAWTDYVIACGNLRAARTFGVEDADLEWLENGVDVAWNALSADIGLHLFMSEPEAVALAEILDDVAGRAGVVPPGSPG